MKIKYGTTIYSKEDFYKKIEERIEDKYFVAQIKDFLSSVNKKKNYEISLDDGRLKSISLKEIENEATEDDLIYQSIGTR